jgi:hypothetical protein
MALRPNVAKLKDVLLKSGLVDEFQMRSAMGRLEQWGGRLTGVIVEIFHRHAQSRDGSGGNRLGRCCRAYCRTPGRRRGIAAGP